jgi:hypothetical protein
MGKSRASGERAERAERTEILRRDQVSTRELNQRQISFRVPRSISPPRCL